MNAWLSRRLVLSRGPAWIGAATMVAHPRFAGAQAGAPSGGPAAPIDVLYAGLQEVIRAGRATPFDERMRRFAPIVEQAFDLPRILRTSIGPRLDGFAPEQRAALLAALASFTAASYVANFDRFDGERFEVQPAPRRVGDDEVVQTRIIPPSGPALRLDYVVHATGGLYKITDVLLDGSISRVAVQRSDFRSLLRGGDAAPLIASLRGKTADLAAGSKG